MKKIRVKLALLVMAIIVASSILSFIASTLISPSVPGEYRKNHEIIATSLRKLERETSIDIETMIKITDTSVYYVKFYEGKIEEIPYDTLVKLQEGEVVFNYKRGRGLAAQVMIRGEILEIRLKPNYSLFSFTAYRLWDSLLFFVTIGALLAIIITNRVVRPILQLSEGTQRVALGDFDIMIDVASDDEIGVLTRNFNSMVKELKNMEVLRNDFINNVSHEFKTPMASIKGFATLLKDPDLDEMQREEYANIIVEETDRLALLSSNLLKLSKLENQEIPDAHERFSLDEQIRRTLLLLEPKWSEKELNIDLDLQEHFLEGNEELMQQVWVNLINNAIKFTKKKGSIMIRSKEDLGRIVIEFQDTGIGMDNEVKERVFEKFYQGDITHGGEGSGLGLPLVKRIVEYHQGSIEIESKKGVGSTFTVVLPKGDEGSKERMRNSD